MGSQRMSDPTSRGKHRRTSWAPVPNKPTVSVDVKHHFNHHRAYAQRQAEVDGQLRVCWQGVWPHNQMDINETEEIQRRASTFVSNRHHKTSCSDQMLALLNWLTLHPICCLQGINNTHLASCIQSLTHDTCLYNTYT